MIKASINLQELKRKIYLKAKSDFGWNRRSRAWFNAKLKSTANSIGHINP
jgi:hypothetical protein